MMSNFELLHRLLMAKLALKLAARSAGPDASRSEWRVASDRLRICLRVRNLFQEWILASLFFVFLLRWRPYSGHFIVMIY
jgi:hypothetical protein